jgi:hypothetical protein
VMGLQPGDNVTRNLCRLCYMYARKRATPLTYVCNSIPTYATSVWPRGADLTLIGRTRAVGLTFDWCDHGRLPSSCLDFCSVPSTLTTVGEYPFCPPDRSPHPRDTRSNMAERRTFHVFSKPIHSSELKLGSLTTSMVEPLADDNIPFADRWNKTRVEPYQPPDE